MNNAHIYDVAIIGGGLAGLSLAIQLKKKDHNVLVLEKEGYPRHKVCGEYISMESKPFLEELGLPVSQMKLPVINKLKVTDVKGFELNAPLPQGGFGISRYKLDASLAKIAEENRVTLMTKTRVEQVQFENEEFTIKANNQSFAAKVVCGAWGKRSNIDVKWQRNFTKEKKKSLNNYIGIKYHIQYDWPDDLIALHNFSNGYCGISKVEDGKCCLCYLTNAANLQKNGNNIKKMEQNVLMRNPHLKDIFAKATFLYEEPLVISQISFQEKEQVQEHVLLTGDTAGLITPLCGNGMSMAFHSSKIAFQEIDNFLAGRISRMQMEENYKRNWRKNFSTRLTAGRVLQSNFGKDILTTLFLKTVNRLPFIQKRLIEATSGKPF
ncbi:MAG TPA: NAD(P)/FAD-dependent oxidoreductase [Flavipsychrobacter sp.]|nr:NAD(P)/FAD-dependent oxidoreductase [Flavipsychrobacter sp.]